MLLDGWYSPQLVFLSILIASLASYTALDLAARLTVAQGRERLAWLAGGSVAMGVGIWSMHFVGMLAFHLPRPMAYGVWLVLLSVLVAIVASAFALTVVSRRSVSLAGLAVSALWMGPAIAGMHYIGMAALQVEARMRFDPALVTASVVIAVAASFVGLWLAYRFRSDESGRTRLRRLASGAIIGGAIAGMHYTGMAAATFTANGHSGQAQGGLLATRELTIAVVLGTLTDPHPGPARRDARPLAQGPRRRGRAPPRVTEARGHRTTRGRRRPRLQQPAHGDHGPRGIRPRRAPRRVPDP